jgi:geranylgeranyl pyrophosphate synthase
MLDSRVDPGATAAPRTRFQTFDFASYLSRSVGEVDDAIQAFLLRAPDLANLRDGALYGLGLDVPDRSLRGKRLRAILCLLTCEALGGDPARAMPFAVASELFHNLALIHDDIADQDVIRRWRPAVWVRYGVGHGINIGDYLFSKAIESTLELRRHGLTEAKVLELVELVVTTASRTIEGQSIDIDFHSRRDLTVDDYLKACVAKTGYYLAAPAVGGAIIAGASRETLDALHEFGDHAGPAFQIIDDLLDLTRGKGRGEIGADIKEGKRSLPVILVGRACTAAERQRLYETLDRPRAETSEEDVSWVIDLFSEYQVTDAAFAWAQKLLLEADRAVSVLPEPLSEALCAASEYMVIRRS